MNINTALNRLLDSKDLSRDEMVEVMTAIMSGEVTPAQIAGFLIALRMKGETVDEISAAAQVMRELSTKVEVGTDNLVDTCGTGGDGLKTFNISTVSAVVAAAAGARVAKHGNRSVSSSTGSADVLEALGVNLQLSPEQVASSIDEIGIGFMFAPAHHGSMKHAIGPRKELGVRTIFNLLGPLTNPASAKRQVMGVFDVAWLEPLARVLKQLGSEQAMMVCAFNGLDEISAQGPTSIVELNQGEIRSYMVSPGDFGLEETSIYDIQVSDAQESAKMIQQVLANQPGAARDIVCLNAGAAIYSAGVADSLTSGVSVADSVLSSGAAEAKLKQLIEFSNGV